jgi:hypothetical protein
MGMDMLDFGLMGFAPARRQRDNQQGDGLVIVIHLDDEEEN